MGVVEMPVGVRQRANLGVVMSPIVGAGKLKLQGSEDQTHQDDINSEILESLIPGWERQRRCPDVRS